jgi:hypothetical protein
MIEVEKEPARGQLSYPPGTVDHGCRYEMAIATEAGLRVYWETNDLENAEANGRNMGVPFYIFDDGKLL